MGSAFINGLRKESNNIWEVKIPEHIGFILILLQTFCMVPIARQKAERWLSSGTEREEKQQCQCMLPKESNWRRFIFFSLKDIAYGVQLLSKLC